MPLAVDPGRGPNPSLYDVLGVQPDAAQAEIEQAWKQLIRENHPDRAPASERAAANERAAALNAAYQTLSDSVARTRYDRRHGFTNRKESRPRMGFSSSDEALAAFIRHRQERRNERIRAAAGAIVGVAALIYTIKQINIV